jgi:integrase
MAYLEFRYGGNFRLVFCYGGKKFSHSLGKVSEREARSCKDRLEENLRFVERGLLEVPPGADLGLFLISSGKLNQKPALERSITLRELFAHYQEKHPTAAKEENTRYTEDIHIRHLSRLIGEKTAVRAITMETLQSYVDARSKEAGRRGELLSHVTIKKEIGTFASIWNKWALPQAFVAVPSPTKSLVYHKVKSKPPFQTWSQIERQLSRGGLTAVEENKLWNSLFLTLEEIDELLQFVRKVSRQAFVYVMFCLAAHTGARRSEILRSRVDDFDFDSETVTLREKKRDRSKELTFRSVPMSPFLKKVMREWFAEHPGGQLTICEEPGKPLSPQLAAHHFRWTVDGSNWEKLLGWHVLRHSFASNCAAKGIDQRLIDEWMGHQTEEMRKRYRHLIPSTQRDAIRAVFGRSKKAS